MSFLGMLLLSERGIESGSEARRKELMFFGGWPLF